MHPRTLAPLILISLPLLAYAAAPTPTPPPAAEIALQRTLDLPFTLNLPKVELSEAFKQIAATAKIALQVDPACYDALPYGNTTRVSADFRQSKLRDALEEILIPLGLQQTVSSGPAAATVLIRPATPLTRIGRRADWEELKLLQDLRTGNDLKIAGTPFDLPTAIRASLEARKDLVCSIAPAENAAPALDQIKKQLPLSPYRALELYTQLTNQTWFVEAGPLNGGATGGTVRIMSIREWILRQLDRPIQLSRTNERLEVVIADLNRVSGIRFVPEPGLYQAVPVVSLASNNGTVRETLEALAGATRIAFDIREDSILLRISAGPSISDNANNAVKNEIIGRIGVPVGKDGLQMDLILRESDLSPELNELRKQKLKEAADALRKSLTAPTPPPTPASAPKMPATAPAATNAK